MSDPDLRQRLDALIAALAPPVVTRDIRLKPDSTPGAVADSTDVDAQRVATTQIDELLRRVSALTGILSSANGGGWDHVDQLAAKLLLADLAAITSTTRALNDLAASRLAGALADLRAAGVDVQRAV